jgi:hypothetical protein
MNVEMAAGFVVVIACLLATAILVYASRRIIEKSHRKSLRAPPEAGQGGEENQDLGDAR